MLEGSAGALLTYMVLAAGGRHHVGMARVRSAEEVGLDLGVENEDEGTAGTTDNVGEGALEEGAGAFILGDLGEAVNCAVVHLLLATRVHHESTTDGVKRVGNDTSGDSDKLSVGPHHESARLLGVREEHGLASVEHTEVRGTVGDDTDDRDTETSVETLGTILSEDLLEAVDETGELTLTTGADVSSKTGTGEIERVDDGEGSGTSSTTRGAVADEEHAWLLLGVVWVEGLLVEVLEGEVKSLGGEVPHDVGEVTSPERSEALLVDDTLEAVTDTVVAVFGLDSAGSVLHLEEELDTLDGGHDRLGDGRRDTTDQEIGHKALLLLLGHCVSL